MLTHRGGALATEADWVSARKRTRRVANLSGVGGGALIALLAVPAMFLSRTTASGDARYPAITFWLAVMMVPTVVLLVRRSTKEQKKSDDVVTALTGQLTATLRGAEQQAHRQESLVRRQDFETRLANALDMAEGEPEVIVVVERSFASTLPGAPVELLLADNSRAHLLRVATASPTGTSAGCTVGSPDHCPAARRAQVQRFDNSDDLDACPKMRGRPDGAISALCVPVSIMGRTVGVIHATGPPHALVAEERVQDLGTVAKLAGARLGLLRVMAETQLQASTDSLTGLLNRRSFEQQLSLARRSQPTLAVAMSDLDHFKALNDTYGHDTGDRALRLFARVLTESVRAQDLICRHGGEEFVVALPGCTLDKAHDVFDAVRGRLDAAITVAGLPKFTASFGVIEAGEQEDLPALVSRADAALFQAKTSGRDRVVVHDLSGQAVPTTRGAPRDVVDVDDRHFSREMGPPRQRPLDQRPGRGEQRRMSLPPSDGGAPKVTGGPSLAEMGDGGPR
jgi:diguanylate cyclase (GGDEF)-like protein